MGELCGEIGTKELVHPIKQDTGHQIIDHDMSEKIIKLPDGTEIPLKWFFDALFRKKFITLINRWRVRVKFKELGMSLDEYVQKHNLDKGTLGRYLTGDINGSRKKTEQLLAIEAQLLKDGIIEALQ